MRAWVCVYLHPIPRPSDRLKTERAADGNSFLRRYLELYDQKDYFYDWGDDPGFYSATELLDDVRSATWGVCRRDVRSLLKTGDYVVFVCAREASPRVWEYYFSGLATMGTPLTREQIWSDPKLEVYRSFLNVLARIRPDGRSEQYEVIRAFHPNWKKRITAPYWVFDESLSALDVRTPLHVASYDGRSSRGRVGGLEIWRDDDPLVARLHEMLLRGTPKTRGLRTTSTQRAHTRLPLLRGYPNNEALIKLRTELLDLIAPRQGSKKRRGRA